MNDKDLIKQWRRDIHKWLKSNNKFHLYQEAENKVKMNILLIQKIQFYLFLDYDLLVF